jgi:hypothetical protein
LDAELALLEYEHLKEEQRLRIASRDNLMYATLVSVGTVSGASLQPGRAALLLVLPAVCIVLGWTYVSNDRKVSQIGRHVLSVISPRLTASVEPFPWENTHRAAAGYRIQKAIQAGVTLLTFCGPGVAALVTNRSMATHSLAVSVLFGLEIAGIGLLAQQILAGAGVRHHR